MGLKSYPKVYFELLLSDFALIMGMSLPSALLSVFAFELNPSASLIGFAVSAWLLSRIFLELPSGVLADRIGRHRVMIYGLIISATGALLCSSANQVFLLAAGRGLWGLGTAMYFLSSASIIMSLFAPDIRGKAMGIFQGLEFVGAFIGTPIGGFLSPTIGYRGVFFLAFTLTFCSLLIVLISKDLRHIDLKGGAASFNIPLKKTLRDLKRWSLIAVCINSFSSMLVSQGMLGTIFPLILNKHLKMNVELIGVILSLRSFGFIVATITSGYLSNVLGRKALIVLGRAMESISFFLYAFISSFEMFILVGLFGGFGSGTVWVSLMVLLSDIASADLRSGERSACIERTFMDIGAL